MSDARMENATSPPPQGSSGARLYRVCAGCGLGLDVTMLLPRRRYRCVRCHHVFRHDRAFPHPGPPPHSPVGFPLTRTVASGMLTALLIWIIGLFAEQEDDTDVVIQAAAAGVVFCLLATPILWRMSRDAAGAAAAVMIASALGALIILLLGRTSPDGQRSLTFASLVWLGLGGIQLSRFLRNRHTLPAVGENGVVRE